MSAPGKVVWRIYRHGHNFIIRPKGGGPLDYLELKICAGCSRPEYKTIELKLVGEWPGRFTDKTGRWLAGVLKTGYKPPGGPTRMIAPVRFLSPREIKALNARLRALGEARLIAELIEKGWTRASANILAGAMLRDTEAC